VGQEKLHIVKQYLEPLERERAGLKPEDAEIHEDAGSQIASCVSVCNGMYW
jgi:hypothetical protein